MQSLTPEFFMLLGIDFFLALSLLTAVFDKYFPEKLAYLYQVVALAGFGQLLVTREFMASFADYMRFWYSFIYLLIGLANIAGLNAYLYVKKSKDFARLFAGVATTPTLIIAAMFFYNYAAVASHPIVYMPQLPLSFIFINVFAFDVLVVSLSIYALIRPKWWQVAIPATVFMAAAIAFVLAKPMFGEALFVAGAIYIYVILGIACIGVLGACTFVLLRLWRESHSKEVKS
jgi:hypothetical protein